jgi:UDP-N-acetylmuramoylalanine--D-glutamate ligase
VSAKQTIILGKGVSGKAAHALLEQLGQRAVCVDESSIDGEDFQRFLAEESIEQAIISPGFSIEHAWVKALANRGIPIRSELELGWRNFQGKTIALTGSNGKSTAVKWICEILRAQGYQAHIAGNYGIPISQQVIDYPEADWFVVEVSSFQLEGVHEFRPDIGVLLNLYPNHLNRHGSMEVYAAMKGRIFGRHHRDVQAILPYKEREKFAYALENKEKIVTFGTEAKADIIASAGNIQLSKKERIDVQDTYFSNGHLFEVTAPAVVATIQAATQCLDYISETAKSFNGLAHRYEWITTCRGVDYINDSKATNLSALAAGVELSKKPVRLLAGGVLKEENMTFLKEILAERVVSIYLFGVSAIELEAAWAPICKAEAYTTLEKAFKAAHRDAVEGEVILLSPGCASFDQYSSFEERGTHFRTLVEALEV